MPNKVGRQEIHVGRDHAAFAVIFLESRGNFPVPGHHAGFGISVEGIPDRQPAGEVQVKARNAEIDVGLEAAMDYRSA